MSQKVRPLTLRMCDELQLIQSGMELEDYLASLRACGRAETIVDQLRMHILQMIKEEHQGEIAAHQGEIAAVVAMMPGNRAYSGS